MPGTSWKFPEEYRRRDASDARMPPSCTWGFRLGRSRSGRALKTSAADLRHHFAGKSNRLDEREVGLVESEEEFLMSYEGCSEWAALVRRLGTSELARLMSVDRSTVKRWKSGQSRPRRHAIDRLHDYFKSSRRHSGGDANLVHSMRPAR